MTAEELFRLPDDNCRNALVRGELQRMAAAGFRILTAIILPCACHAEPQKTGRGWVQVATLYRSLSLGTVRSS